MYVIRNLEKSHVFFRLLENCPSLQIKSILSSEIAKCGLNEYSGNNKCKTVLSFTILIDTSDTYLIVYSRSVQTFENKLLALLLVYVKYYSRGITFFHI
jgi:hypothetical protein